MFENLSQRLTSTLQKLSGKGRLTEENIRESLREVRVALLEADVALPVVKQFIEDIKEKAVGKEVLASLRPGQALIKIVSDELTHILGDYCDELNLKTAPPAVILLAGLQGSGKTTTAAKLAKWLQQTHDKKVLLASADVYRPAAIDQLQTLSKEIEAGFFPSTVNDKPLTIAQEAITQARKQLYDVVIIDTAGRLHIDQSMMAEIKELHQAINPIETLFVVDSMTGQDAANTAKAFNDALELTGVIVTKTDGDARGGAALSIRSITGKPIKFIGVGEKIDNLEPFHPDRIASRILGKGDILSLVEEIERKAEKTDIKKAQKLAKKIKKGKGFTLEDFNSQLKQMRKMGGLASMMGKLPGMGKIPQAAQSQLKDSKMFVRMEAIINSMTPKERHDPEIINGSRKKRIALGSGSDIQDINRLLKQFKQMQKMMKKMAKGGGMMRTMQQMAGKLPPGMGGFDGLM